MRRKLDRQSLLGIVTFGALLLLLVMQFLFLKRAADLEEKHFNHRVVLALREARNEIAREANACNHMNNFVCGNQCPTDILYINFQKVDSILQSNLEIHKITLDYTFEFINESKGEYKKLCLTCYEQSLNGLLEQNGIRLQIKFPHHSQFLFAQMGYMFYLSIGVIIFVMVSFLFTSRLFKRQKGMLIYTKDFIDNMVHEFQTPIANIKLASNLVKKNKDSMAFDKLMNYCDLIQLENQKIEGYVGEILGVASMTNDHNVTNTLDVHKVIKRSVEDFRQNSELNSAQIKLDFKATNYIISGEEKYFHHSINNLIDNAIKYSKDSPDINISTYNLRKKLIVEVRDKGIGIDRKDYGNIFQKYYRVSQGDIHNIKGFGLGLHFVKRVVEKYNGSIRVKSQVGKGSTFSLFFKVKE